MLPFPMGTVLRLDFWLDSEHIKITAVVRTCDPGVGNGIEFMTSLKILSGGAAQGLVASVAPKFKAMTGLDI